MELHVMSGKPTGPIQDSTSASQDGIAGDCGTLRYNSAWVADALAVVSLYCAYTIP